MQIASGFFLTNKWECKDKISKNQQKTISTLHKKILYTIFKYT